MHKQKDYYLKLCKKKNFLSISCSYVIESRTYESLSVSAYFSLACEKKGNICKQI